MNAVCVPRENAGVMSGYRLKRLRGAGSFGQVWEAEGRQGETVALKVVQNRPGVAVAEIRNMRNVCQLDHQSITRIEKVLSESEHMLFVMELADGSLQDLADISVMEFGIPLSAQAVCEYIHHAAEALDFLNARRHLIGGRRVGVQHRDVKPSNLLLFGDRAKLCDFGLATPTAASIVSQSSAGTTAYAAPEVFHGRLSDWTDQYALAVTYCHVRGVTPFPDTPADFRRDYVRPAPDLSKLSDAEQPIVARALAPVPQDRWPTCGDMTRQLLALLPGSRRANLAERRLRTRHLCPHRPVLSVATPGATNCIKATVVNLSHGGLGVLLPRPLGIGIDFHFLAPNVSGREARLLTARVVRSMPQTDGSTFAGCRLATPFSDEEFQRLLAPTR